MEQQAAIRAKMRDLYHSIRDVYKNQIFHRRGSLHTMCKCEENEEMPPLMQQQTTAVSVPSPTKKNSLIYRILKVK